MEKIGIVVEDAADLPQEIIEKYQIATVRVKLSWPDIENLPGNNTFQKMREAEKRGIKSFGKTSQPPMKDYFDRFEQQLSRFDKILCTSVTSKLSGSYNSALQGKKFLKEEDQQRVFIIDSLNVSGGQALVVLKAIDLINEGKKIEEIVSELEKLISQVHVSLILEDLKWVEAAGRISHLVASVVRGIAKAGIRPVMAFKNGVLAPAGLKTDAKDIPTALFKQLEHDAKNSIKEGKRIRVIITHGDDLAGAQRLKEMIEKEFKNTEIVFVNIINDVVGVLAGPNAMLLSWCEI